MRISNRRSEAVYRRRTGNTMAQRKRTKGETMIYKTLHRKQEPTKTGDELRDALEGLVVIWHPLVTLFTNPVISHDRGKDQILIMTNGTYLWSFVTQLW